MVDDKVTGKPCFILAGHLICVYYKGFHDQCNRLMDYKGSIHGKKDMYGEDTDVQLPILSKENCR